MTKPNLARIKEDFDKVISWSQNIPNPQTDRLFDNWLEAKRDIIEVFDGQYIYEYPDKVSFELGEKEKHDRVMHFASYVESQWGYSQLASFIEDQEDGFFDNITVSDYRAWNGKMIKKGTKLVKAFKHFIENERSLTDIQNEASRIIQENKIEGTLCLSVHPLDFLSVSENTYNWRSCHALDGEYRAGNLSYMMDKHTVVCYLKASDNVKIPSFPVEVPWNSKKWRVLLYFSSDWKMIFAGRQYPFETSVGINFVLKEVLPKTKLINADNDRYAWSDWNNLLVNKVNMTNNICVEFDSPYVPLGNELIPLQELVKNEDGAKHYNDVLFSSCYSPIYAFRYGVNSWGGPSYSITNKNTTTFHLGAMTYCLWCGEKECLTGADTMLCEQCELEHGTSDNEMFTYCDSCGRRIFTDDAYVLDDEDLCEDCYDKYTSRCERCGEVVWSDDIHFHEPTDSYICECCLYDIEEGE